MKQRRQRAFYPDLGSVPRGMACDIERPECGENKGLPVLTKAGLTPGAVMSRSYVFERELPRKPRSKYCPHEEAKKHGQAHR